jgi:hypothetical protein
MHDNLLLAEKHRVQKALDEMAEHDLAKYVSDTHDRVEGLAIRLGLKLKYGTPGLLKPSNEKPSESIV